MTLDRRTTHGLVQAILRAQSKKDASDVFENVAQTSMASGYGSYGEPALGGMRFYSAPQPGVTTGDRAAHQSHKLIPTPRPHPFRDPAKFYYVSKVADMAKAHGIPAHDQLAVKVAPGTLSRLASPQTSYGRPLEVNAVHSTEDSLTGGHPTGRAFHLNNYPATDVSRVRPGTRAAQTDFSRIGTYQSPQDAEKRFNEPRVTVDTLRRRPWGRHGPAEVTPPGHRPVTLRLADGDADMATEAPHRETKLPEVHYRTSGEIWSEFLGGIGKGIAQSVSDMATNGAKARLGTFGGVYVDTPNPELFKPPTSPWDDAGRKMAPGVMVVIRPVPRGSRTWRGKIIGKVTPPENLKPGTVPFGNYMHEKIAKFLETSYDKTSFRVKVKPGQRGVDMEYLNDLDPGFKYLDIKSNKPHSQKELDRQIYNWGYEGSTVRAITYDEHGNIYDGFGH